MCLIINKPSNIPIPDGWIEESFRTNNDGWGVMWSKGKKLAVEKGFKLKDLKSCLKSIDDSLKVAVHMRKATSGQKDEVNCHPIRATKNVWVMHNGIIQIPEENKKWSDTKHFVEFCIRPILIAYPNLFGTKLLAGIIEHFVGMGNKLLLMNGDGEVMIIHENQGTWRDKCWVSNTYSITSYTPPKDDNRHAGDYMGGYGDGYMGGYTESWRKARDIKLNGDKETHWCEGCRLTVTVDKKEWTQVAGIGWICPICFRKMEEDMEKVKDVTLEDLLEFDYQEILDICESSPETVAWAFMLKGDKYDVKLLTGGKENVGSEEVVGKEVSSDPVSK
jgi:hypothetical protein